MLRFWPPIKKMAKATPCLGKYVLLPPNIRKVWSFSPLSSQKVAFMAPFLGHVASSQQFWNERGENCYFLNKGLKSQHFKT